jgi:NDP-sugar pyrophosphorylase family protein
MTISSESVAVILAATVGSRLFPMTSPQLPKHLLPVAGVPNIIRLLKQVQSIGFSECVVALAVDDAVTIPVVKELCSTTEPSGSPQHDNTTTTVLQYLSLNITFIRMKDDCQGSAEALRHIESTNVISPQSYIIVFPGDAVILEEDGISRLARVYRERKRVACAMLLTDEGQVDEHGVPLKESAKQKRGNLAREEEDIEYIGLSFYQSMADSSPRVIWKQSKIDVEHDKDMTSATPKLILPKARLRHGITRVRTDWNDVHVYAISPWVRKLIIARVSMLSLQGDLLPLLIARQFKGTRATFGGSVDKKIVEEALEQPVLDESDRGDGTVSGSVPSSNHRADENSSEDDDAYSVLAIVQNAVERANSVSGYLHATKQVVTQIIDRHSSPTSSAAAAAAIPVSSSVPNDSNVNAKFATVFLPGANMGSKVNLKGSVIGYRSQLGDKCRLNNVIIMNDVVIGENTILQNSIIGTGCRVGENCNLNDCQVAPGKVIPAMTKEKGESFTAD